MSAEQKLFSRRGALRLGLGAVGLVGFSTLLTESRSAAEPADYGELREFLKRPLLNPEVLGPNTSNLLAYIGLEHPAEVRWVHRANSLNKIEGFIASDVVNVAEVDCRYDERREALYISHDRDGKSDIDPKRIEELLIGSSKPKVIKFDYKDANAMRQSMSLIDPARPCVINADLFNNGRFDMDPNEYVELCSNLPAAIISIGRKGRSSCTQEMLQAYIELVSNNPDREFTLPVNLIDFMNNPDLIRTFLDAPNTTLTVYRIPNYQLTRGHVNWIKQSVDDGMRAKTFFDL